MPDIDKGPVKAEPHKPVEDPAKTKKMTIAEKCADLAVSLNDAVIAHDTALLDDCWAKCDALYEGIDHASVADQHEIRALSRRFHHLAPRPHVKKP
jgi:hypothetical protein